MNGERKLDGDEIRKVLTRAGELQVESSMGPADGLSVDALEDLALQSGLDPALVRQALAEMDQGSARKKHWFLGESPKVEFQRRSDGELDGAHLERLVEEIEETLGTVGTTRRLGRGLIWTASHGIVSRVQGFIRGLRRSSGSDLPTVVTLAPEGKQTSIAVTEDLRAEANRIFLSWFLGMGIPAFLATSVLGLVGVLSFPAVLACWMVLAPVALACARTHFGSLVAQRNERLSDLLSRVAVHLEAGTLPEHEGRSRSERRSLPTTREEEAAFEPFETSPAVEVDGSKRKGEAARKRRRSRS